MGLKEQRYCSTFLRLELPYFSLCSKATTSCLSPPTGNAHTPHKQTFMPLGKRGASIQRVYFTFEGMPRKSNEGCPLHKMSQELPRNTKWQHQIALGCIYIYISVKVGINLFNFTEVCASCPWTVVDTQKLMHLECAFEKSDDANPALIVPKLIQLCGLVQPFSSSVGFLYLVGFICVCKFFWI